MPTPTTTRKRSSVEAPRRQKMRLELEVLPYFIVALAVILLGVVFCLQKTRLQQTYLESTLQAVFLTNGQVYFGDLDLIGRQTVRLDEVFYLQQQPAAGEVAASEGEAVAPNAPAETGAQFTVVRLGQEIHQPEDHLIINRDQILFWENLRPDSQVLQAIREQQSQ